MVDQPISIVIDSVRALGVGFVASVGRVFTQVVLASRIQGIDEPVAIIIFAVGANRVSGFVGPAGALRAGWVVHLQTVALFQATNGKLKGGVAGRVKSIHQPIAIVVDAV